MFESSKHPHRRFNPLTGEYVLVSPHRTRRPWLGQVEDETPDKRPEYDPKCYLCPGNTRANGEDNPAYESTYVFENDFRALLDEVPFIGESSHPLMRAEAVNGTCRVVCFSPRHDLTLPQMEVQEIRQVVDIWAEQTAELGEKYRWVQVFENKGQMMGSSNPHPHGQIWASDSLPNEAAKEDATQRSYHLTTFSPMLMDYLEEEIKSGERIVVENNEWVALVPYWAVWPYELMLLPRQHVLRLPDLDDTQRDSLADILKRMLTRYDNLFQTSFPYSMGWHGAPFSKSRNKHWQLHAHFYPPLLRSATVKKFMVGYEMLAEPQRDLMAEQAAENLRALSETYYLDNNR